MSDIEQSGPPEEQSGNNTSGGVDIDGPNGVSVGRDVVGRDKIEGDKVEGDKYSADTIIVVQGPADPNSPPFPAEQFKKQQAASFEELLKSFKEELKKDAKNYQTIPLALSHETPESVPDIRELFVELEVECPQGYLFSSGRKARAKGIASLGSESKAVDTASKAKNSNEIRRPFKDIREEMRCSVILGDAGSGKTFLLYRTALDYLYASSDNNLTPIYISLRHFEQFYTPRRQTYEDSNKDGRMPFCDYLAANFKGSELSREFFSELLNRGSCLILLDGLDRTVNPSSIARCVNELILADRNRSADGENLLNRYMITARPIPWQRSCTSFFTVKLWTFTLTKLEMPGIQGLFAKVVDVLDIEPQQREVDLKNLNDLLNKSDKLFKIAQHPMNCTLLALVVHTRYSELSDEVAPRHVEFKIYDEVIDHFLGSRDARDNQASPSDPDILDDGTGYPAIDYAEALESRRKLLSHLAYEMQQSGGALAAKQAEDLMKNHIAIEKDMDDTLEGARHFLKKMLDFGILTISEKRMQYNFIHDTFREYLTAERLLEMAQNSPEDYAKWGSTSSDASSWVNVKDYLGNLAQDYPDQVRSLIMAPFSQAGDYA